MFRHPAAELRRRSLLVAGLGTLAAAACAQGGFAQGVPAKPLQLGPLPPGSKLELLGGLQLDDEALGFGGLSALHLGADLQVTAISDLAHWMTARIALRTAARSACPGCGPAPSATGPASRCRAATAAIGIAGPAARRHLAGGVRALAPHPRLPAAGRARHLFPAPPGLEAAGGNGGLEALAALDDGRLLAIAEAMSVRRQARRGARLARRPAGRMAAPRLPAGGGAEPVRRRAAAGWRRAGAGAQLFPVRRFRWAAGADPGRGAGGGGETVLEGEEILRIAAPLPVDNFEGVSAARIGGRTLVAMISDDNQNLLQRTMLLLFVLADD